MTAPVFVDATGRRARRLRGICWVLASVLFAYVLLVAAALVAPSDVLRLKLPGLGPVLPRGGAPALTAPSGEDSDPAEVVATLPTPSAPPASVRPTRSPVPHATGQPSTAPTATGRPTAVPTAGPTATPSTPGRASGRPTARPTPHATKSRPPHP